MPAGTVSPSQSTSLTVSRASIGVVGQSRIASWRQASMNASSPRARERCSGWLASRARQRKELIASVSCVAKSQCGTWPSTRVESSDGAESNSETRLPPSPAPM